jgi:raffinose/stachyose/melibiose transport system permease protein
VLAFVSLTLAPAVIFYLMAQKYIIAGLTSGAVKG